MAIFNWILLGLTGLLLLGSAVSWGVYVAIEESDWRRLAVRVFRYAMVCVLLLVNVNIYAHIVGGLMGP